MAYTQRFSAIGADAIPPEGPVIIASRHYHHLLDGVGFLAQVDRPVHILVALDWVRNRATRAAMEALNRSAGWPVTLRSDAFDATASAATAQHHTAYEAEEVIAYQRRAYRECLAILRSGGVLVVFPEGHPVIDPHTPRPAPPGVLAPFKSGFARLAVSASRAAGGSIKVVPVGIRVGKAPAKRLTFNYGNPRTVSASSSIETLTQDIYTDVLELSST